MGIPLRVEPLEFCLFLSFLGLICFVRVRLVFLSFPWSVCQFVRRQFVVGAVVVVVLISGGFVLSFHRSLPRANHSFPPLVAPAPGGVLTAPGPS